MCTIAAEIEAADGGFVARPIEDGTHREELVESEFAVENVAAGETVDGFEVERSNDLHVFDEAGEIGSVVGESFDDGVAKVFAAGIPVPFPQLEGRKLDVGGEDVLAFRRERGVEKRGDGDVEIGRSGKFAIFGGVECTLEIIDFWADVDAARESFESVFGMLERREGGKTVKSEMNFGDGSVGADVADAEGEGGIELRGIKEMEESAFGIDAGNDGFDLDFFAVGKDKGVDGAVFDEDVLDFGVGADFGAGYASGIGESASERAEPATRKSGGANGMRVRCGAEKKNRGGTGGPRTEGGAEDAAGGDGSAEQFRFEKFGDEIGDSHGAPAEKIEDAALAEAANAAAGLEKIPEIFGGRRIDGGWRDGNEFAENGEKTIERFRELRVFCGVFGGEAGDAGGGFSGAIVEEERFAIGTRSEDAGIGAENFAIEFLEVEIAGDIGAKRAQGVRKSGRVEAGMKFLGDGAAADHFAAFENERLKAAFCEIERGDESVMAAADEGYALSDGHD